MTLCTCDDLGGHWPAPGVGDRLRGITTALYVALLTRRVRTNTLGRQPRALRVVNAMCDSVYDVVTEGRGLQCVCAHNDGFLAITGRSS